MTEKQKKGSALFKQGYNCAQAVFAVFSEEYGVDETTALRLAEPFGGGLGRQRLTCGAVAAACMALGLARSGGTSDSKQKTYEEVNDYCNQFRAKNGSIICRELLEGTTVTKGIAPEERTTEYYKKRPCGEYVTDAIGILEAYLQENR